MVDRYITHFPSRSEGEGDGFEEESRGDRSKCAPVAAHLTRAAAVTRSVENKYRLLINASGAHWR